MPDCENKQNISSVNVSWIFSTLYENKKSVADLDDYDKEILPVVEKVYEKLLKQQENFAKAGIELLYDGREKKNIKEALQILPFAKQKSSDAADYRISIRNRIYQIFERKTHIDLLGSIGHRNDMQHLKMRAVPIPHHRKYYLLERVEKGKWEAFKQRSNMNQHQIMGSRVNTLQRDGYQLVETQSLLDTLLFLLKLCEKTLEHIDKIHARLKREPYFDEIQWDRLSLSEQLSRASIGTVYFWDMSDMKEISAKNNNTESVDKAGDDSLSEFSSALKAQNKNKKRIVYKEIESLTEENNFTGKNNNQKWVILLSQIHRMNAHKAQLITSLFASAAEFVHSVESNPMETFNQIASLSVQHDEENAETKNSRKLGPKLAAEIFENFGLSVPSAKKIIE